LKKGIDDNYNFPVPQQQPPSSTNAKRAKNKQINKKIYETF
tara:strand:+ start:273 stop:395 length:123 start_codon:yes stop_codon:yes gene_type:complete